MEDQQITVGLVLFVIAVVGAAAGVWWRIEGRIKEAKQAAYLKSDAANLRAETNARELAEHRTHVAEHYISKQGFRETMDSLSATLATINTNLAHLNERIDRVIDNQNSPPKRGSQQ